MAIILIKSTLNILHKYDRSAFCIAIVVHKLTTKLLHQITQKYFLVRSRYNFSLYCVRAEAKLQRVQNLYEIVLELFKI